MKQLVIFWLVAAALALATMWFDGYLFDKSMREWDEIHLDNPYHM